MFSMRGQELITLVTLMTTFNRESAGTGTEGSHQGQEHYGRKGGGKGEEREIPAESPLQEDCKRATRASQSPGQEWSHESR